MITILSVILATLITLTTYLLVVLSRANRVVMFVIKDLGLSDTQVSKLDNFLDEGK